MDAHRSHKSEDAGSNPVPATMLHKVKVQTKTPYAKIWVDDKEIHGVTEINYHEALHEVPTVTLSLSVTEFELDGEILVRGLDGDT